MLKFRLDYIQDSKSDYLIFAYIVFLSSTSNCFYFSPSPSLKHKTITSDDQVPEKGPEEYSGGSLAGSMTSGSSGFGSLPKKRPALLTSGKLSTNFRVSIP